VSLTAEVRETCAAVARVADHVTIDLDALAAIEAAAPPALDPERHYLEGSEEDVATYLLTLDAVNFGSGWFPVLRKRPGCSGYFTVASALTDRFRAHGPWTNGQLRAMRTEEVAVVLGQSPGLELMSLYAQALRELGAFLGDRTALELVAEADGSAVRFAEILAAGMPLFADTGFYKRAQIAASDLALAGVASFSDLDKLTIFADNLVPHVLRTDGILRYSDALAAWVNAERLLPIGGPEGEIRACAVHACELISQRLGVPPRELDGWLWNRGQDERYKARPRHRTRTVYY
jgi:Queuosine salvage protein